MRERVCGRVCGRVAWPRDGAAVPLMSTSRRRLAVGLVAFSFVPVGEQTVGIPANDPTKVPVTNFVKVLD